MVYRRNIRNFLLKMVNFNVIEFPRFWSNARFEIFMRGFFSFLLHFHAMDLPLLLYSIFHSTGMQTNYSKKEKTKMKIVEIIICVIHQMNAFTWQLRSAVVGWRCNWTVGKFRLVVLKLLQRLHSINEALKSSLNFICHAVHNEPFVRYNYTG